MSFTFYGHSNIIAQAKALCEVEEGPTYEITLKGEASLVNYSFDTKDIHYGLQVSQTIGWRFSGFALSILNKSLLNPSHRSLVITPVLDLPSASLTLTILLLPTVCQILAFAFLIVS